MKTFDAIIIGTGQAGVPLAVSLAKKGWKVAAIERGLVGGSCVNYGCTPTKALVADARRAYVARGSAERGIAASDVRIDFKKIMARQKALAKRFREGIENRRFKHENITLMRGTGSFVDPQKVRAGDETIEGRRIFINTGAESVIPPIPGLHDVPYLTSTSLLDLEELPEHLVIIGGGYIGLEFAQIFRRFGSKVTIIQKGPRLAATEDEDMSEEIKKVVEGEGITVLLDADVRRVEKAEAGVSVSLGEKERSRAISGSHLLVATGRSPSIEALQLENAGVKTERGAIVVNEKLETNVPNVWALGDVKGGPAFTQVSYNDYEIVYRNLVLGEEASVNDRILVYAMFIDPSLGRAGLTEREAKEKGLEYKVAEYPMSSVARAIELDETAGKMKLIVDAKTEKILGAAILGYEGAELVHYVAAHMNAGASYKVLQRAITIHPALSEGIQSLALKLE